ncbi:MAG: ferredoxin family protein [Alphaproteobacteria bacterium]|nr:ferredoxin family protein [Alphaproteobacteria bacterium]
MTYVVASACVDVKDKACLPVCPVDCIYVGGRMVYIQPEECIDCALCLSVCPVDAIYPDDELPANESAYRAINAEFFGPQVTGWGKPGGSSPRFTSERDHPTVTALAPQPRKA